MNNRTRRLLALAALCISLPLWAGTARAHGVTLKVHHGLSADSPFHTQFLLPWTQKIEQESGGRIRFRLFPALQMGGAAPELYDQVKEGVADIVWTGVGYTPERFPAVEVFELPLAANSAQGWDAVTALEIGAVVKYHTQLDPQSPWLYSEVFVLAMNPASYKSLPDDLRKVISANCGADASAWLGSVFDAATDSARKLAADRGDAIDELPAAELARWREPAQIMVEEWIKDLDGRGLKGRALVESARTCLAEYDPPK